jgi:hypothetical protein
MHQQQQQQDRTQSTAPTWQTPPCTGCVLASLQTRCTGCTCTQVRARFTYDLPASQSCICNPDQTVTASLSHFLPPPPPSPGTGCVLASLQACAELPTGVQKVEVVAAHKVLRQADDGGLQAGLAVVVGRVLRHVTSQLRHLRVGGGGKECIAGKRGGGRKGACERGRWGGGVLRHVTCQLCHLWVCAVFVCVGGGGGGGRRGGAWECRCWGEGGRWWAECSDT